jgi:hypothetical protein
MVAGMVGTMTAAEAANPLAAWRWKSRLLLVFAPDDANPDLQAQRRMLASAQAEVAAHDLLPIEIVGNRIEAAGDLQTAATDAGSLRHDYGVPRPRFAVILIGKDGGEKLRQTRPISAESVVSIIDRMPMGSAEFRQRSRPAPAGIDRP